MRTLIAASFLALSFAGCRPQPAPRHQGYLEGEFVYVAAPLSGRLEKLAVTKGARVEAGAPLFTLEQQAEVAAARQAAEQLHGAEARLADLRKGVRPEELAALGARWEQTKAASELARLEFERVGALHKTSVVSDHDFDRARLVYEQTQRAADELSAQLAVAKLGGRTDAVLALEAEVQALQAAKEKADWSVSQKIQTAPAAALVYDTLFREGEFIGVGAPVVSLLPPANLKVRFFVAEAEFARVKVGANVRVSLSGRDAPLDARVTYLSAKPEYTPPILYNRENRAKLVFMVEAVFDPAVARDLHPGQPVDVAL